MGKNMICRFGKASRLLTKVTASTLLETIVASVIFMIIFTMALDTMTRIMTFDQKDDEYLLIESSFSKCEHEIKNKKIVIGDENYIFEWGNISVTITHYNEHLYLIDMSAETTGRKNVSYKYILANETIFE